MALSAMAKSILSSGACAKTNSKCFCALDPANSPSAMFSGRFNTIIFLALLSEIAVASSFKRKCGITLENQDPGPIVIQSASAIARSASGVARGFSGMSRRDCRSPLAKATSTCPLIISIWPLRRNVPSISKGSSAIGNTRPIILSKSPT